MRTRLFAKVDHAAMLRELHDRRVNFTPAEVRPPGWRFDTHRYHIADEAPGSPLPGGAWEIACGLVCDYEFSVPARVRAVYDRTHPLLERTMLLEGRFYGLRFYMGTRVSEVVDETKDDRAIWGWAYDTLDGHLERGRMRYLVVKHIGTGRVDFMITGYSQRAPGLGRINRLGWWLFGRATQVRFYRRCGSRLRTLVRKKLAGKNVTQCLSDGDLVLAPAHARPRFRDRLALPQHHPGERGASAT